MPAIDKKSGGFSSRAWEALQPPLSEWILEAVSAMGFRRMTPVQASTMPLFLGHKDVVVEVGLILLAANMKRDLSAIGRHGQWKDICVLDPDRGENPTA